MTAEFQSTDSPFYIPLTSFQRLLFDHVVPLSDLLDHRGAPIGTLLPFWRKHGLIPFIEKGKWAKLSFVQLIWLRMLDSLRSLGYPVEKTKAVAQYFFLDAYQQNLPKKNLEHNKRELLELKGLRGLNDEETTLLRQLQDIESSEALLYALKLDINYLSNLITDSLFTGKSASVLVFSDGTVVEKLGEEYLSHSKEMVEEAQLLLPHITLSITHFLTEFIEQKELSELFLPMVISEDEERVLREIQKRNVRKVTIHLLGGKVQNMESTSQQTLSLEKQEEIRKVLGLKNYERLEINTVDQKTFTVTRTNKKAGRRY